MSWLSDTWRERIRARVAVAEHVAKQRDAEQRIKDAAALLADATNMSTDEAERRITIGVTPFRRPLRFPRPGDPDHVNTPHPDPDRFRRTRCECAENNTRCSHCRNR